MNKFNEQVSYWAHMLDESARNDFMNEDVQKSEDGYYAEVSDNGRWLLVKHVLEIFDSLPEGAYQNPYLASSLPAQIFGYVNGISEQTNKFGKKYVLFTIAPYVNGSRRRDYSAGAEGEPLRANEIKKQLAVFRPDEVVLVRLLDWKNGSDVVLIPFTTILASKSDGVFLRLDTPCEKLEDNASKNTDFGMSIALMMKRRNESMETKYTKKQILEAILHWTEVLESMDKDVQKTRK